jgi:NADP-dependent 3-hydroxy acid dehydrogenase YdfG
MWNQKVIIITGASAGIGRETALALGKKGASVALCARRGNLLQEVAEKIEAAGGKSLPVVADVSDSKQIDSLIEQTLNRFQRIDVLINNAASGLLATVEETTPDQMERLWQVNFMSTFYAIRKVLPLMRQQNSGHIITVASMSGRRGAALKSAYCVTKFAQVGFMESLRMELAGSNIHTTLIFPGATDTDFFTAMENPGKRDTRWYGPMQKPDQVAEVIVHAIEKPSSEVLSQKIGRLQLMLHATSPAFTDWLVRNTVKRKQKI